MAEPLRILILEDNPADAELVQFELEEAGINFTAKVVSTEKDFTRELAEFSPGLILSDYDLPLYKGSLALVEAGRICPDTPFILVSGAIVEDRAIEILTQGAKDYVLKTKLQQRLVPAVKRALAEAEDHRARKQAEAELREAHKTMEEKIKIRTSELEAEMTARKKITEALQLNEERYRILVQHAPVGIYDIDFANGHFTEVNDAMCQVLGYTRDELLAMTAFEIISDEDKASFAVRIRAAQSGEKLDESAEYRVFTKTGRFIWALLNIKFHWASGRIVGATVLAHDITERKQAEEMVLRKDSELKEAQQTEAELRKRIAQLEAANKK